MANLNDFEADTVLFKVNMRYFCFAIQGILTVTIIKKVSINMKAPYKVLVFLYYKGSKGIKYVIFHRSDGDCWQCITS